LQFKEIQRCYHAQVMNLRSIDVIATRLWFDKLRMQQWPLLLRAASPRRRYHDKQH
jgi:hypothetical protein